MPNLCLIFGNVLRLFSAFGERICSAFGINVAWILGALGLILAAYWCPDVPGADHNLQNALLGMFRDPQGGPKTIKNSKNFMPKTLRSSFKLKSSSQDYCAENDTIRNIHCAENGTIHTTVPKTVPQQRPKHSALFTRSLV